MTIEYYYVIYGIKISIQVIEQALKKDGIHESSICGFKNLLNDQTSFDEESQEFLNLDLCLFLAEESLVNNPK